MGVFTPGPPQEGAVRGTAALETAVLHDIAEFLAFRRGGCGDVAVHRAVRTLGKQGTAFKIGGRSAEDEVDIALDVAVPVIMPSADAGGILLRPGKSSRLDLPRRERRGKEGILVSQETAGVEEEAVPIRIEGQGLSGLGPFPGAVFKCDAACGEVVGVDEACPGAERTERPTLRCFHAGGEAAGDYSGTVLFPEEGQMRYAHGNLFPVDSVVQE